MAGGNPRGSSAKPPPHSSASSSHRKSRWESAPTSANNQPSSSSAAAKSKPATKPTSHNPPSNKPTTKRSLIHNNPNIKPSPSNHRPKPQSDFLPSRSSAPSGSNPLSRAVPFSAPDQAMGPAPPPSYGFHMLDRRTIVLADGSVRSYFALPLDYQDFVPPPPPPLNNPLIRGPMGPDIGGQGRFPPFGPMSPGGFQSGEDPFNRNSRSQDYWNSLGLDGRGGGGGGGIGSGRAYLGSLKRKFGSEDESDRDRKDEFARQRQQLLQYGNVRVSVGGERSAFLSSSSPFRREDEIRSSKVMRTGGIGGSDNNAGLHHGVDPLALKKAFLHRVKVINEHGNQKKNYLANGRNGHFKCPVCERSAKDFPDVHALIMHAYKSEKADLRADHLGLHKALCVLMGWNYVMPPDESKSYQYLPADEVAANQDDIIMWPPMVMVHNTSTGKGKEGRMEGLGNKAMDAFIRALGFSSGKSKSLYSRDGHLGITLIKFAADKSGLMEAIRLAEHFEKDNHGRKGWARIQSMASGKDNENNPDLVKVDERTGDRKRIFYGHLATVFDLEKVDFETRKKVALESKQDYLQTR